MARLPKNKIVDLSNADIAALAEIPVQDVDRALRNYGAVMAVASSGASPAETVRRVLEEAGFGRVDPNLAAALVEAGTPRESLAEIAETPGVGFATLRRMVPTLLRVDVPGAERAGRARHPITARDHVDPLVQLETVTALALAALNGPTVAFLPNDQLDRLSAVADDADRVGDAAKEAKDAFDAFRRLVKELRDAAKAFEKAGKRPPIGAGGGASGLGGPQTNETVPSAFNGELIEDEYGRIFGEALLTEKLYTVWMDRWMAFEVDGLGDDSTFGTFETTVSLTNPDMLVRTSFITSIYNIDERQEYRLKPSLPVDGRRALPLDDNEWKIRGFLEERDTALALRVGGLVRGFPLSRLKDVVIRYYLYESDRVQELIDAVAALGAGAIAALSVIKGGFAVPAGGTAQLTDGIANALAKLNTLINKDEKLLYGSFTFRPSHFREAFRSGQIFEVRDHASTAACGLGFQRDGGGEREDGKPVDLVAADAFFDTRQDDLKDPDFYEDEFESYYELRLRFERVEPEPPGS